jgi:sugar lactone lactonase YvrE
MREQPSAICLADVGALVGEGPVWLRDERKILWVDIAGGSIFLTDYPSGSTRRFPVRSKVGAIVPRRRGGFIAASASGIYTLDPSLETWSFICHPESHLPGNRFNDGKCDPAGRLWVGSIDNEERERCGSLYVIHPDLRCERILDGLFLSNGLDWSPDGSTFYLTDTLDRTIWAFDFDSQLCTLANRRAFASIDREGGYPDGLCVDGRGFVWSARWGGGCVVRYSPDGVIDSVWPVPAAKVSSCTFGGPDLRTLIVTTACHQLTPNDLRRQPAAGGLFHLDTGYTGQSASYFSG